jgi:hypothetical protein
VQALLVPLAYGWTAYNDLCWLAGQRSNSITWFMLGQSGELIDHSTGVGLGVTLAVIDGGTNAALRPDLGAAAEPATDAAFAFSNAVDCAGLIAVGNDAPLVLQFTGLDTNALYEVVLFANRGDPAFSSRWMMIELSGATAFVNKGSAVPGFLCDVAVCGMRAGYNTDAGQIARFTEIVVGPECTFSVAVLNAPVPGYANAVMLKRLDP